MPQSLPSSELQRLARFGAQARLEEIEQERAAILRAFPGLDGARAPEGHAEPSAAPRQRRRRMSAAEKRAVSERMKKYWAARRSEKQAGEQAAKRTRKGSGVRKRDKEQRRVGKR